MNICCCSAGHRNKRRPFPNLVEGVKRSLPRTPADQPGSLEQEGVGFHPEHARGVLGEEHLRVGHHSTAVSVQGLRTNATRNKR